MKQVKPLQGLKDDHITIEMTIQEYMEFLNAKNNKKKNTGKGLSALMDAFKCSKTYAYKISKEKWFQPAIIYKEGRTIIFDMDMAFELAKEHSDTINKIRKPRKKRNEN